MPGLLSQAMRPQEGGQQMGRPAMGGQQQEQMGMEQPPQEEGGEFSAIEQQLREKIAPEQQGAFDKVVTAGLKVMFSPETHELMKKELEQEGPIEQKLGVGIAGLMLMLDKKSNGTIPQAVIIPAAVALMGQAADFVNKAGVDQVDKQAFASATKIMVDTLLPKYGVTQEGIVGALNQNAQQFQGGQNG